MKKYIFLILLYPCFLCAGLCAQNITQPNLVLKTKERPAHIVFSPDGHLLAVSDENKTDVSVWDTQSGELKGKVFGNNEPTDQSATWLNSPSEMKFSPDGRILAVVAYKANEVRLWNVLAGKLELTLHGMADLCHLSFSPDGKILALSSFTQGYKLMDLSAGKMIQPKWNIQMASGVNAVEFCSDNKTAVVWLAGQKGHDFYNSGITLIDIPTGQVRLAVTPSKAASKSKLLNGKLSHDGTLLLTYGDETAPKVWDVSGGTLKSSLSIDEKDVYGFTYSPDNGTIIAIGKDKRILLWDSATGKQKAALSGNDDDDVTLLFSPDGKLLAAAGKRGVKLWNLVTGELKQSLSNVRSPISFSDDGKLFAAVSVKERSISLWQLTGN